MAAIAAIVGGVYLWLDNPTSLSRQTTLAIYAASLVALFTVSCLYHMVPWSHPWKARMQRLDHTMIFVLVAGSFTPVAWTVLDGWPRSATLLLVWGIAVLGSLQKWVLPHVGHGLSVGLQTTQGWLALLIMVPFARTLGWSAVMLAVLGGVLYTLGMVLLVTRWPRLWPRVFSYHEAMHVLVIAAGLCHFVMIARYVAPYAAG